MKYCKCGCPENHHWAEGESVRESFCTNVKRDHITGLLFCVKDEHKFEQSFESEVEQVRLLNLNLNEGD